MKRSVIFILGLFLIGCAKPAAPGDRIVVQSERNGIVNWFLTSPIYAIAADGSGEVAAGIPYMLVGPTSDPDWSPDGQWIVYSEKRNDAWGIELIRADGSHHIEIPLPTSYNDTPRWSPDGEKIAFVGFNSEYDDNTIQIVDVSCLLRGESCQPAPRRLSKGSNLAWSPDGQVLAYSNCFPFRTICDRKHLYIINADGSNQPIDLTSNMPDSLRTTYYCADYPSWSPDGRRLVFSCGSDIYLINRDGSGLFKLAEWADRPTWFPDGRIAFISNLGTSGPYFNCDWSSGWCMSPHAIFTIDADGSHMARLTPHNDEYIEWNAWWHVQDK